MKTALLSLSLNSLARIASARVCLCNNGSITELREADRRTADVGSPLHAGSTGEDPPTHRRVGAQAPGDENHLPMSHLCIKEAPGSVPFQGPIFLQSTSMKGKPRQAKQTRAGLRGSVQQRGDRGGRW